MDSNLSVSSVHVPSAMNGLSIRGRGKKWKQLSISDVQDFAIKKSITFVQAYTEMCSKLLKNEE